MKISWSCVALVVTFLSLLDGNFASENDNQDSTNSPPPPPPPAPPLPPLSGDTTLLDPESPPLKSEETMISEAGDAISSGDHSRTPSPTSPTFPSGGYSGGFSPMSHTMPRGGYSGGFSPMSHTMPRGGYSGGFHPKPRSNMSPAGMLIEQRKENARGRKHLVSPTRRTSSLIPSDPDRARRRRQSLTGEEKTFPWTGSSHAASSTEPPADEQSSRSPSPHTRRSPSLQEEIIEEDEAGDSDEEVARLMSSETQHSSDIPPPVTQSPITSPLLATLVDLSSDGETSPSQISPSLFSSHTLLKPEVLPHPSTETQPTSSADPTSASSSSEVVKPETSTEKAPPSPDPVPTTFAMKKAIFERSQEGAKPVVVPSFPYYSFLPKSFVSAPKTKDAPAPKKEDPSDSKEEDTSDPKEEEGSSDPTKPDPTSHSSEFPPYVPKRTVFRSGPRPFVALTTTMHMPKDLEEGTDKEESSPSLPPIRRWKSVKLDVKTPQSTPGSDDSSAEKSAEEDPSSTDPLAPHVDPKDVMESSGEEDTSLTPEEAFSEETAALEKTTEKSAGDSDADEPLKRDPEDDTEKHAAASESSGEESTEGEDDSKAASPVAPKVDKLDPEEPEGKDGLKPDVMTPPSTPPKSPGAVSGEKPSPPPKKIYQKKGFIGGMALMVVALVAVIVVSTLLGARRHRKKKAEKNEESRLQRQQADNYSSLAGESKDKSKTRSLTPSVSRVKSH